MSRILTKYSLIDTLTNHQALVIILCVGAALRVWHIDWGLPYLYEEAIPLRYGMQLWDLGQNPIDYHFFVYPAFTYYVQYAIQWIHFAIGYLTGAYSGISDFLKLYSVDPTRFVIVGRMATVFVDTCLIIVVYKIVEKYFNKFAAILAVGLLSINILHIKESQLINVDSFLALFSVLTLYYLLKLQESPTRRWYLLSGVSIGLAAASKYNGAILLIAFGVAHFQRFSTLRVAIRSLFNPDLLLGIAMMGATFLIFNPLILYHPDEFAIKFKSTEIHMEAGHLGLDQHMSTPTYYLFTSLPHNLGTIFSIISGVSILFLILNWNKTNRLLLTIPLLYAVLLSMWQMRADRYIFPMIPHLIMIGSIGLLALVNIVTDKLTAISIKVTHKLQSIRSLLIILSIGFITVPMIGSIIEYHHRIALPDTRTIAKEWIENTIQPGSSIASGPYGVNIQESKYLKLLIQFSAVNSEQMAPFYHSEWYQDLDLLILSDYDYGRYLQEPERFREILGFYDHIKSSWSLLKEFQSDEATTGPTIWIYRFSLPTTDSLFDLKLLEYLRNARLPDERKISFLGKLGLILSFKNQIMKSEQVFKELLTIDPSNDEGKRALMELQGKIQRLAIQGNEAVDPRIEALLFAATALYDKGDFPQAEKLFLKILTIDKTVDAAYQSLMLIYAINEEEEKVLNILTSYLKILSPDNEKYNLIKNQIEVMRDHNKSESRHE